MLLILLLIIMVGGAARYVYRKKKTGVKCIGCSCAKSCPGRCKEK